MQIADIARDLVLIVPLLLVLEAVSALVVWLAAGGRGGRGARIAAWLGLTTLTLWAGSLVAFVAINLLVFNFGSAGGLAGFAATTAFMVVMPFGWAHVVRRRGPKA